MRQKEGVKIGQDIVFKKKKKKKKEEELIIYCIATNSLVLKCTKLAKIFLGVVEVGEHLL